MKKISAALLTALMIVSLLTGCGNAGGSGIPNSTPAVTGTQTDLGDDNESFGDSLEDLNSYSGYFEDDEVDITVSCVSGTPGCYTLSDGTLTFASVSEDSVYSVSGQLKGNIVIDTGDDYKFDLELQGFSLVSDSAVPILILSGDEVSVTAKSELENYLYDQRAAVDASDETTYSAAIYSVVDLEICGKGSLTVISEHNNGIHSKDDLEVKNLTLLVSCVDNALKGNDSVTITGGALTLIATQGDGIKTTNSDISDKGNQRGTVTITGGTHTVYAACDGIDAAYDVVIEDDTTELSVYTDKYSNYSSEVTAVSEDQYYIRFTSNSYQYSVKYYNSDDDYTWVTATYHSSVSGSRYMYYYYSFPKMSDYSKMQFFIYSSATTPGQDEEYLVASDYLTPSAGYDTFALTSQGSGLMYSWTNYTTTIQDSGMGGMGGMSDGNTDKSDYSTKGIKAENAVRILGGIINIKSYDDALHASNGTTLENGSAAVGSVTVSGGVLTVYSNDDGLHADSTLTISGGIVNVTKSYEGLEGNKVVISGGNVTVLSSDDGINATATSGTGIEISGGMLYIYCTGDGIDANSRTSYSGIVFSGGTTVVISNSGNNSAIDTEQGYAYSGGVVLAVMPRSGMKSESSHCSNFSSIATSSSVSLTSGNYLTVSVSGTTAVTVKMPCALSATVIYLGSKSATVSSVSSTSATLDANGVAWGN